MSDIILQGYGSSSSSSTTGDYTAWPTAADVSERLAAAGVTNLRVTSDSARFTAAMDAVVDEVQHTTHRQFVASEADEVRYFDGSGTPEVEIDEYVSFTAVGVVGYLGTALMDLANCIGVTTNTYPNTRIQLYRGSLPGLQSVYFDRFPVGRQNIAVTGTWGYAASIPVDLWEGVCGEIANRLVTESMGGTTGRLTSLKQGPVSMTYDHTLTAADGWHDVYQRALHAYTKPAGRHLRRIKAPMI